MHKGFTVLGCTSTFYNLDIYIKASQTENVDGGSSISNIPLKLPLKIPRRRLHGAVEMDDTINVDGVGLQ